MKCWVLVRHSCYTHQPAVAIVSTTSRSQDSSMDGKGWNRTPRGVDRQLIAAEEESHCLTWSLVGCLCQGMAPHPCHRHVWAELLVLKVINNIFFLRKA